MPRVNLAPKVPPTVVSPRWAPTLEAALPEAVRILLDHYRRISEGRSRISLTVPMIPPSLNHQYLRGRSGNNYLDPKVSAFRDALVVCLGNRRREWSPKGITAAVLVFESPVWVSKANEVRENDVDNKPKPTLDALKLATGVPDELHFQVCEFKLLGKQRRTHIWAFDLGNDVDACAEE
jgi:hypothetical protein